MAVQGKDRKQAYEAGLRDAAMRPASLVTATQREGLDDAWKLAKKYEGWEVKVLTVEDESSLKKYYFLGFQKQPVANHHFD